ncbi:MAG: EAL domain-containing protein [bacterium]
MKIKQTSFYITKLAKILRNPSWKAILAWIFTIVFLLAFNWLLLFIWGEFTELIYFTSSLPIIIASVLFKVKGGVLVGLIGGTILLSFTPFFPLMEEKIFFDDFIRWTYISGSLVLLGAFIGGTFEMLNNQFATLEKISLYDPNSELPNSSNLIKKVEELRVEGEIKDLHLIMIDIKNHEEIMNSISHKRWGKFLKEIATQLKERQEIKFLLNDRENPDRDMEINVYNIYHNKLGFLMVNISTERLVDFIEELKDKTRLPFYYNKIPVYLDPHLGLASYQKGDTGSELLQHAYHAMSIAVKEKKKFKIYEEELETDDRENFLLLGEVRNALDEEQFELHYMPKVKLRTGKITGVEALIRWPHPEFGNIFPGRFIPLVEKTGLIDELTRWVINRAAEEKLLLAERGIDINMAVNISPHNLKQEGFVDEVKNIILENNLDPAQFELELTETEIMGELIEGNNSFKELLKEGIKVSMDDFGTGYSSLAYLKNLDINTLKIDLSFVQAMQEDKKSYEIVKTAIRLGQVLDKEVVAEGIENLEVMEALDKLNCDYGQGYYISKPVPREDFVDFYYNWQT